MKRQEAGTAVSRTTREGLIAKLAEARGGTEVITYVTSTRQNAESQMAMDVIAPMYRHLLAMGANGTKPHIDLFIHSNGGDGIVPWRLVTLIREFCADFTVLVPNRAFSAATLTALGADKVLMHPMGMLGPTDPTVQNHFNPADPNQPGQFLGISVEDVTSYIALVREDVGIHHEDELIQAFNTLSDKVHPLALGNVKRSTLQSRMMGEKLLRRRERDQLQEHEITEIVRKLTSELYFHGHPINRHEAREELGLSFVQDAPPEVADAMWNLYVAYEEEMKLDTPFDPMQEAIAKQPLPAPPPIQQPGMPPQMAMSQISVTLDPVKTVYVESASRCDVFSADFEVVITRDSMGNFGGSNNVTRRGWGTE